MAISIRFVYVVSKIHFGFKSILKVPFLIRCFVSVITCTFCGVASANLVVSNFLSRVKESGISASRFPRAAMECPVCFEAWDPQRVRPKVFSPCAHSVCAACVEGLREKKCPTCRQVRGYGRRYRFSIGAKNRCKFTFVFSAFVVGLCQIWLPLM